MRKLGIFGQRNQIGQSLVELLVAIGLVTLLLPALLTGIGASRDGRAQHDQKLQATAYLRQAEEATRSIARINWGSIATNGTYHPIVSGSSWVLNPGSQSINGFSLEVVISDAFRDSSGAIVESGGTLDPSTKKINISVSWTSPLASSVEVTSYATRYKNAAFTQTSVSDFNAGTAQGTIITNTNGGEVTLGAGGGGDWCSPNLSIPALDLPKQGVANAISAIEGKAFAGTGENASGVSYASVIITNTTPPTSSVEGTFDGFKTNDIFGETNYAYLATDTNSKEIEIIDLTGLVNGKYVEAGYFNAPGNGSGRSVFVVGNTGYMTSGSKLYNFDLSSKIGSRPIIDTNGVSLNGTGKEMMVVGNYAYVVTSSNSTQLQIVDVSDSTNLTIVGQASLSGGDGDGEGMDIFVNSSATRAYVVTAEGDDDGDMFIVDIATKTGNRPTIGVYDTNDMDPRGVVVVPGNKAIVVGKGEEEYQVVNIANEASPVRCGGLNINSGVNGIASVLELDGDAYSYIITGDSSTEFKIIEGGPGGQFSTSGTFTSNYFDAGATVAFNRLIPNFIQPQSTTINFQVAVAAAVSGSCVAALYYFVGPDGTPNTYFTSAGAIPVMTNVQGYTNPGQCIKYKAYFSTSDTISSPILNDVSVNYSL